MLNKVIGLVGLALAISLAASVPKQLRSNNSSKIFNSSLSEASNLLTSHTASSTPLPQAPPPIPKTQTVQPDPVDRVSQSTIAVKPELPDIHLEISLKQRQVSLYRGNVKVKSYPVGIGRAGWETPTGTFKVKQMRQNPTWISPFTGERIPNSNPRNPLGRYWIGFWTNGNLWVGFHGTPDSRTIGNAASHGCIHLRAQDLKELYQLVNLSTMVKVTL